VHGIDSADARAALARNRIALFAAMPADSATPVRSLAATDLTGRCALIIGSEARGVSAEWREAAAGVSIPTAGVESLNASVAAGILLYEARRQRMSRS
jgi:TrmH family RNA methyltransferase